MDVRNRGGSLNWYDLVCRGCHMSKCGKFEAIDVINILITDLLARKVSVLLLDGRGCPVVEFANYSGYTAGTVLKHGISMSSRIEVEECKAYLAMVAMKHDRVVGGIENERHHVAHDLSGDLGFLGSNHVDLKVLNVAVRHPSLVTFWIWSRDEGAIGDQQIPNKGFSEFVSHDGLQTNAFEKLMMRRSGIAASVNPGDNRGEVVRRGHCVSCGLASMLEGGSN